MRNYFILLGALLMLMLISCSNEKRKLITERIQYDVNIKSPNPDFDWWIQNLVGPDREALVREILSGAQSGKYACWDYYNDALSPMQVRAILSDTMIFTVVDTDPPYDSHDTTIINTITVGDIQRLRFLEKWETTSESLKIIKTVYGIAPVALTYDPEGNERWYPLFWIYLDDHFAKNLINN